MYNRTDIYGVSAMYTLEWEFGIQTEEQSPTDTSFLAKYKS